MKSIVVLGILSILIYSCNSKSNKELKNWTDNYFDTFSLRKDSAKFNSFYAKDFTYKNISFGYEASSPEEMIINFYGWFDPGFKYHWEETIELESVTYNDSTVIAMGFTLPHKYNDLTIESMPFVIKLDLDKNLRIIRQTDWYNYCPPTE